MVNVFNEVLDGKVLRFDLVPTEGLLGTGSPTFVTACVEGLGLRGPIANWSFDRFCSPFFSVHKGEWRGRILSAWHVTVNFEEKPNDRLLKLGYESISVDARDSTAPWNPESLLEWTEQRCVVIGLFPLGNWSNMNRLEGTHKAAMKSTTGTERLRFKGLLEQGRFDLGKATFPEAEERVNQVCDAIRTAGGSAHCDEPIPPSRIAIPPS